MRKLLIALISKIFPELKVRTIGLKEAEEIVGKLGGVSVESAKVAKATAEVLGIPVTVVEDGQAEKERLNDRMVAQQELAAEAEEKTKQRVEELKAEIERVTRDGEKVAKDHKRQAEAADCRAQQVDSVLSVFK